jgi:hypothetical protein
MYFKIVHEDRIEIREIFSKPMVYLDNWALNDISIEDDLRKTFISLMNSKGGMLRLSIVNMIELANQCDKAQLGLILSMIAEIKDCGLINIDPGEVINKEDMLISNPLMISIVQNPSAELELVATYLLANNHPEKWHISDLISGIIKELPSKRIEDGNRAFLLGMESLIRRTRSDRQYLDTVSNLYSNIKRTGPEYQAATRELLRLSLYFVIRNHHLKMSKYSEWNDIFHLIVPVAYCDFVLMDRRWKTFIDQTGFSHPAIARVFDKRSLHDFFNALETEHGRLG